MATKSDKEDVSRRPKPGKIPNTSDDQPQQRKGGERGARESLGDGLDPALTAELCRLQIALQQERDRREKAEAALRESQNLLQAFAESIPDPLFVKNAHGQYELINPVGARFFGRSVEEVIGKADTDLFPDPVAHRMREEDQAVVTTGKMQTFEDTFRVSRDKRTIRSTRNVYRDHRGQIRGVIGLARDITAHKQEAETLQARAEHYRELAHEREQQLILSDRLVSLGELAASLAHELNNPLGIIQGFAQDLAHELPPAATDYQPLKIIEEEARRCAQLVSDLLNFARPSQADLRPTDLAEVVRQSLQLVSGRFRKGKIKVVRACPAHLPPVLADPQQLQQVLLNLFFNALEAMPNGGTLTVRGGLDAPPDRSAQGTRAGLCLLVTDTGTGIQTQHLSKIFRPFFTTKVKGGMGLGLSICESIIHTHGGRIEVESSPGQGTTVCVFLPGEGEEHGHRN